MGHAKFWTIAVTVRPPVYDPYYASQLRKWAKRKCEFHKCVKEKGNHLHMAAQLWKEDCINNKKAEIAKFLNLDKTKGEKDHAVIVKIFYSYGWCDYFDPEGCPERKKGDQWEEMWDEWTDDETLVKFPPPDDESAKKKFKGDPWYLHMEELWNEYQGDEELVSVHNTEITPDICKIFIKEMMCVKRRINVLKSFPELTWKAKILSEFISKKIPIADGPEDYKMPDIIKDIVEGRGHYGHSGYDSSGKRKRVQ